jgi:hypothetical protein
MTEYTRRLSDKILFAFNQACDQGYFDVAEVLIRALELALTRQGGFGNTDHRQNMQAVTDAYSRLQTLKSAYTQ